MRIIHEVRETLFGACQEATSVNAKLAESETAYVIPNMHMIEVSAPHRTKFILGPT